MKILLLSYGDYDYDGRLRELLRVAEKIGTVSAFTRGSAQISEEHELYHGTSYLRYVLQAVRFGKKNADADALFLDNRKSIIPGLLLRLLIHPKAIVQDCRELYTIEESDHFAGKVGCIIEREGLKHADVVICANSERAIMMQKMYNLKKLPLVYENLRRLEYAKDFDENMAKAKYESSLRTGEIRILSTSGCSVSRTNDILVQQIERVSVPCRLFLIGDSTPADRKTIEQIAAEHKLTNVEVLGKTNQSELKFLIKHSHIGVVNYNQCDLNNKYCASGKLYEFIFEGIPVVTTTNPPLKRLCDEEMVGVADDLYADGINRILSQYADYQENVRKFAAGNTIEANNELLAQELSEELKAVCG